ncbi:MAG: hypothetical protein NTZ59_06770 [Bacteroidetes bacterium]|nr:hypothetical protein [Bacteroidota bacterium]
MKKLSTILLGFAMFFLASCSGSETYRGAWKAMDKEGEKFELVFKSKSFSVKDSLGVVKQLNYKQTRITIENGIKTYGITLKDGRSYEINFPKANDESIGLIKDENGTPIYTICRKEFTKFEDILN